MRYKRVEEGLLYPYSHYIPAYDAFRAACLGFGSIVSTLPAGVVLNIGLLILNESGFLKPIQEVQQDLVAARSNLMGYFDQIRALALVYFNTGFDESAKWTYHDVLDAAARLEIGLAMDLSIETQQPVMPQPPSYRQKPGKVSGSSEENYQHYIRKGGDIDSDIIAKQRH